MSVHYGQQASYDNQGRRVRDLLSSKIGIGVIYLGGDEFTDGSVRVEPAEQHIGLPHIEVRNNGLWKSTGLFLAPDSLAFGNDVSVSAIGSHLLIYSFERNTKSLLLETVFNDAGSMLPHTHVLGPLQERVVFVANEIGEIVTNLFELPVTSALTAFRYKYYFKTGSVAAIDPVMMMLTKGFAPGGELVFEQEMPASQWTDNTEVVIELSGAISLTAGAPLLLSIMSDSNFSLIGDDENGGNFFAMDFQSFALNGVLDTPYGVELASDSNGKLWGDAHSNAWMLAA